MEIFYTSSSLQFVDALAQLSLCFLDEYTAHRIWCLHLYIFIVQNNVLDKGANKKDGRQTNSAYLFNNLFYIDRKNITTGS